jgi:ribosomal protein S18 acetylase RimI-like enzyme
MPGLHLKPILTAERDSLAWWIDHAPLAHIHVGWLNPARWVGRPVSLQLVDSHNRTHAALVTAPDALGVAWVQAFACGRGQPPLTAWQVLWETARESLTERGVQRVWAMTSEPFFADILRAAGFQQSSEVVTLAYYGTPVDAPARPSLIALRPMRASDVPDVLALDNLAFKPPWQMDREALEATLAASAASAVALSQAQVVGYMLATESQRRLHLARLATSPGWQRQGIGRALTLYLLENAGPHAAGLLTVNTQTENFASLKLYQALGFRTGGRSVAVYTLGLGHTSPPAHT